MSGFAPWRMVAAVLYTHAQPAANGEFGDWAQCVGKSGVAAVHASNVKGGVIANDIVRGFLAARRAKSR